MLRRLFAIFRPPVFEDEERTRIASLLTPVLWLMLGIAALIGISALLVPRIPDFVINRRRHSDGWLARMSSICRTWARQDHGRRQYRLHLADRYDELDDIWRVDKL